MNNKIYIFCLLLLLLLIPNISFTPWPEMLSRPYLILHSWLPYKDFVMEHSPLGIILLSAWFKIFGIGYLQLKWVTWLLMAFSAWLVFKLGNRLSVIIYLLLAFAFDGNGIWFDHFLIPFGLFLFVLFNQKKYLYYGLILGLAFWFKQTAVWFILPPLLLLIKSGRYLQKITFLVLGLFISLGMGMLVLWTLGILPNYLHWAIGIGGLRLAGFSSGQLQLPTLSQLFYNLMPFVAIFIAYKSTSRSPATLRLFILAGSLGIIPRWEQFHLQPAIPFLAILISDFYADRKLLLTKVLFSFLLVIFLAREYKLIWNQQDRFSESDFFQAVDYIKTNSQSSDKILVLNTWESLYALADRLPASRPLYPYLPWYLDQSGVQTEIVNNLQKSPPSIIVQGQPQTNGLGAFIPLEIDTYLKQNFHQTVKIDSIYVLQK